MNTIPKIHTIGARHTQNILDGEVVIEEKYDGSQFTFGVSGGKLVMRSKSQEVSADSPGMFAPAAETAQSLFRQDLLQEGWIYCCEFIAKLKHNVLNYERVPLGFLVLYDVKRSDGLWFTPEEKNRIAFLLGIEPVKTLFQGKADQFAVPGLLENQSTLGGGKIEGIVIKNYGHPHGERGAGWPQTAKLVSDVFKEKHTRHFKKPGDSSGEVVANLTTSLRTEARWLKAVQHLRESGKLTNENADIGPLCCEVQADVLTEETDFIKQKLFDEFHKEIVKGTVRGLAQWYQEKLAEGWNTFETAATVGAANGEIATS